MATQALTVRTVVAGQAGVAQVQLYGAARLGDTAPSLASVPARLWVTPGTASPLQFTGVQIDAGSAAAQPLTLSLSLPQDAAELPLGEGQGLSATAGAGVAVDTSLSSARALVLRGSAADLEAFLASATGVRYSGPLGAPGAAVPLTLEIDGAAGRAGLRLELAAPVQPGIVNAGGTMRLPEALVATPGAWLPLALPAHSITGTGVLSLTVAAPADAGLGLRWAADAQLKGGNAVAALTDGSGTALTLRGTAVELSRYLSSGALQVRAAQASALGFTLESTPAAGAAAVVSTGAVRIEYGAPGQAIAASQALTLQVPQALTVDGSGLVPTTLRLPAPPGRGIRGDVRRT